MTVIWMRITFVSEGFNRSSVVGQPWKHVNEIAKRFIAMGNTVHVLTDYSPSLPRDEKIDGVPVHRIKKGRLPLFDSKELLRNINQDDVDVINWLSGPLSAIYFSRLQNSSRNSVVWTIFTGRILSEDVRNLKFIELFSLSKFWNNVLYSMCPGFIIRKGADASQVKMIIVWSGRLKNYLQNIGIREEKIAVISSGVDTERFRPIMMRDVYDQKESLDFRKDDPLILYFGPLTPFRGADTVISAMSTIIEKIPSAKLLLLARRSQNDEIDRSLERSAKAHQAIKLLSGTQTQDALIRYLGSADAVILPFRFWPHIDCPLTILEAMAMGKPVVTTYSGVIPEIVQNYETGILVDPGKPDAISAAVIKLLTDKDLSVRIGKDARRYVRKFHDWDNITRQTLNVFEGVIDC